MAGFLDGLPPLELPDGRPQRRPGSAQKKKLSPEPDGVPCVVWEPVKCPGCGSANCRVVDSRAIPVRVHVCNDCGSRFRSVEKAVRQNENAPSGQ